jgi:hypothetical protein
VASIVEGGGDSGDEDDDEAGTAPGMNTTITTPTIRPTGSNTNPPPSGTPTGDKAAQTGAGQTGVAGSSNQNAGVKTQQTYLWTVSVALVGVVAGSLL